MLVKERRNMQRKGKGGRERGREGERGGREGRRRGREGRRKRGRRKGGRRGRSSSNLLPPNHHGRHVRSSDVVFVKLSLVVGELAEENLFILSGQLELHICFEPSEEVRVDGVPEDAGTAVGCLDLWGEGGGEREGGEGE